MTTEQILVEMLTENTGRHMLDSGGAYGRNWEKNQGRDFENEDTGSIDEWGITLSTYHFLKETVEFDADLDEKFQVFAAESKESWFRDMIEFAEQECDGDYPEKPVIVNTYNHESLLDQTLQYALWSDDCGDQFVLLQIHGGCDVRGGYTMPRAFRLTDEWSITRDTDAGIYCGNCEASWSYDGGGYEPECNETGEKLGGHTCPHCESELKAGT